MWDPPGFNWDTGKLFFSSYDLSRICSRGKMTTLLTTCKERFHLFVITERFSPQWTHSLSNSTIYYLIAIIYSDRITMQNMQSLFSSSVHSWWFATMNSVSSEDMRCRMGDEGDHCKPRTKCYLFPLFCPISKRNWRTVIKINRFQPPHQCEHTLLLSYTIPLVENESLHCDSMLPGCCAPFWRACVVLVGTWYNDSLHITVHSLLLASFTRVKAFD